MRDSEIKVATEIYVQKCAMMLKLSTKSKR